MSLQGFGLAFVGALVFGPGSTPYPPLRVCTNALRPKFRVTVRYWVPILTQR